MTAPAASPAIGAPNGALFFPLLLLATAVTFVLFPLASHVFPDTASLTELTVWVIFVGSGGHVAASFFFYTDREIREKLLFPQRGRFFLVPVAIVLGSALFFSFTGPVVAAWASTAYWVWQTHHYARQNHGILAFASRAGGVSVTQLERTALTLAGVAGVIGMTTFVTPIAETGLLAWGWYLHTVGLGVYAAAWVCYGLSLLQRAPALDMRSLILLVLMLFFGPCSCSAIHSRRSSPTPSRTACNTWCSWVSWCRGAALSRVSECWPPSCSSAAGCSTLSCVPTANWASRQSPSLGPTSAS
jgi:hypothetical protein